MSKDKKDKKSQEEIDEKAFNDQVKNITDQMEELINPKQIDELQMMLTDMIDTARTVQEEFHEEMAAMAKDGDLTESDISASIDEVIQVSENSPYMDEMIKTDEWKKVLKGFSDIKFASGSKDAD